MRKGIKGLCSILLSAALVVTSVTVGTEVNLMKADAATAEEFRDLDSYTITAEMGPGWNLGNTMDSIKSFGTFEPGETAWGNPVTTKEMVQAVHDLGFNNIRIPVSWGSMINDDYSIDEDWIARVKEIVDYAVSLDMYTVINIHHDGASDQDGWLNILKKDTSGNYTLVKEGEELDALYEKFAGTWKSIATYFKDYDEHLIFESMNEVGGFYEGDAVEQVNKELAIINKLNQSFVDTVRATGSNNAKRWLIVPSRCTQFVNAVEDGYDFKVPTDTLSSSRIMVAVHFYSSFGVASMSKNFEAFYRKYVRNGIPVYLGEYGYTAASGTAKRTYSYEGTNRLCKQYGIIPVAWDNNGDDYRLFSRVSLGASDKYVVDGIMRGYYNEGDANDIERDYPAYKVPVETRAITSFDVSTSKVSVGVNKKKIVNVSNVLPSDTNDVILWKSEDNTIATASGGRIFGKGVGTTTVTAYTQGGTAVQTIQVTVTETSNEPDDPEPAFKSPIEEEPTPTTPTTPTTPSSPTPTTPTTSTKEKKGSTITVGGQKYTVTKISGKTGTVTYAAPKNKKVTKVTIPATVKSSSGITYKVTAVKAKALSGCKKLKKVTIGKNVTKIAKNAFKGDSKLKTITVKTKVLKSVGKNAFKGINKKATIKVPKAKLKKYKKLLKKGQAKTVKIKK